MANSFAKKVSLSSSAGGRQLEKIHDDDAGSRSDLSSMHPTVDTFPAEVTHCSQVPPSMLSLQKQVAQAVVGEAAPHLRQARCCE
jgi:hypothetical protein